MELDKKELKIQALLERVSSMAREYEDRDADRRVEITELVNQLENQSKLIDELQSRGDGPPVIPELLEGEVVDE